MRFLMLFGCSPVVLLSFCC